MTTSLHPWPSRRLTLALPHRTPLNRPRGHRRPPVRRFPWVTLGMVLVQAVLFYLLPRPTGLLRFLAGPFFHVSAGHLWGNLPFLLLLGVIYEIQVGHHDACLFFLFASIWTAIGVKLCGFTLIGSSGTMFALAGVGLAKNLRKKNYGVAFILAVWLALSIWPLNLAHLLGLLLGLAWGWLFDRTHKAIQSVIVPA